MGSPKAYAVRLVTALEKRAAYRGGEEPATHAGSIDTQLKPDTIVTLRQPGESADFHS
jgi:hypothetical protein